MLNYKRVEEILQEMKDHQNTSGYESYEKGLNWLDKFRVLELSLLMEFAMGTQDINRGILENVFSGTFDFSLRFRLYMEGVVERRRIPEGVQPSWVFG